MLDSWLRRAESRVHIHTYSLLWRHRFSSRMMERSTSEDLPGEQVFSFHLKSQVPEQGEWTEESLLEDWWEERVSVSARMQNPEES